MTADERIKQLLKRAGCPMMVVRSDTKYSASDRMGELRKKAKELAHRLNTSKTKYGMLEATVAVMSDEIICQDAQAKYMADTIDRLEAALENALNERDALLEEVNGMCYACKNIVCGMATDECKMTGEFQCTFEWRGVQDKEDANE